MTTRRDLNDPGSPADFSKTCAFCGQAWQAAWFGHEDVYVCRDCAITLLPRLIADAVWSPAFTLDDGKRTLIEIAAHFWRTLFTLAQRHQRHAITPRRA